MASNAWSILASLSTNKTHGFLYSRARSNGPYKITACYAPDLKPAPHNAGGLFFQIHTKLLQGLVEFANGFLLVDLLIALQALNDRTGFQDMLKFCKNNKGNVSHLCVVNLSRLSRGLRDTVDTIVTLERLGIKLLSIDKPNVPSPFKMDEVKDSHLEEKAQAHKER